MKTLDQYFDVLTAYADKHPTINGQPTVPFTILTYDWHAFCLWNPPEFLAGYPNDGNGVVDPETQKYQVFFPMDISKKMVQEAERAEMRKAILTEAPLPTITTSIWPSFPAAAYSACMTRDGSSRTPRTPCATRACTNRTWAPLPIVFDESIRPHYRDWAGTQPGTGRRDQRQRPKTRSESSVS